MAGSINIFDYNFMTEDQLKNIPYDTALITTSNFDPQNPDLTNIEILCPTTGDISVSSTATIVNLAEDINNLHGEPIELQQMTGRENTLSFTALGVSEQTVRMGLMATQVAKTADGGIVPKYYLSPSDFTDRPLWVICTLIGGGMFAVKFERFLNTAGFSLSTSKAGKGNSAFTLKGFNSIKDMTASPITYYTIPARFVVSFDVQGHGTAPDEEVVKEGEKATQPTAPTASGYTFGGWYKEAACTNAWDFSTDIVEKDVVLFAKWTET